MLHSYSIRVEKDIRNNIHDAFHDSNVIDPTKLAIEFIHIGLIESLSQLMGNLSWSKAVSIMTMKKASMEWSLKWI